MKKELTIYTIEDCHACGSLKSKLDALSLPYREVKVNPEDGQLLHELKNRWGTLTFPQVYAGSLLLNTTEKIQAYISLIKNI